MIILDTDHITILQYAGAPASDALVERLTGHPDPIVATTIVSADEQMRGWLARIHREHTIDRQLPFYERLNRFFAFIREWSLLRFDEPAADEFKRLRAQGVRIGSMDLKIASIALVHDALLLSANLKDFQRVPGLRVESWIER